MRRAKCTKDNPMTPERIEKEGEFWEHDGAEEVGNQMDNWPCGDLQRYKCKHCGHSWVSELAQ